MNISSVSSTQASLTQMNTSSRLSSMTADQKATVADVLSQYDANSLSQDDAQNIVKAFQEAGIEPSEALASTMAASGFDAKEIGDLAGVGKSDQGQRPMGPPPPKKEEISNVSDLLESLLGTSEDDEDTTSTDSTSSSSFQSILDYTSKIVSLKDDAKSQVMDILTKYNSEENTLSQEDTQKFVINSLSQILKDSTNYNRMSLYV